MELQLALQLSEKHVLKTQTLLCDMLLLDSPIRIATQSPSIMDFVKCDGAALYYQGKYWPLSVTPTEAQIKEIVEWLLAYHGDSTGLSTDNLADAGFPSTAALEDVIYGMAVGHPRDPSKLLAQSRHHGLVHHHGRRWDGRPREGVGDRDETHCLILLPPPSSLAPTFHHLCLAVVDAAGTGTRSRRSRRRDRGRAWRPEIGLPETEPKSGMGEEMGIGIGEMDVKYVPNEFYKRAERPL